MEYPFSAALKHDNRKLLAAKLSLETDDRRLIAILQPVCGFEQSFLLI